MRKYLTTGLFSAILGIVIGGAPADAALVSRGFLDEALENYATTTALDLKADNADLTNLSNIVGTPSEIPMRDGVLGMLMGYSYDQTHADDVIPTNDISELIRLNYTDPDFMGLAGVVQSLFWQRDPGDNWPIRLYGIFSDYGDLHDFDGGMGFYYLLYSGGTMRNKTVYGLPKLTEEVNKIGTLPTEYATVGAALTAIKGIAEDAKAAALAAIPDPKTEGSTGKFVLTVDIVGDNATYRWEKIDREGETTTTTE